MDKFIFWVMLSPFLGYAFGYLVAALYLAASR
jgi:hypothetical protein